jgi:uroporphyrinogen-III synthase
LARDAWSAKEATAFAQSEAALYYSRRSVEIAVSLARQANLSERLATILHVCISENAAEPLRAEAARNIVVAAQATEAGLFEALKRHASAR